MAEKFEKDKRYIFSKAKMLTDPAMSMIYDGSSVRKGWVNRFDGQEIQVMSDGTGLIDGCPYNPEWCEELPSETYLRGLCRQVAYTLYGKEVSYDRTRKGLEK